MDGQSLGSRNAEISRLIKTLTNLSNVNGYHRSDSVCHARNYFNRTVDKTYLRVSVCARCWREFR